MTSPTKQSLPISSDSPIWAELSQSALVHNIEICSSAAGQTPIIAVIKANAYGHGMLDVAHIIEETIDPNTVSHLAVARLDEAALLRAEGIKRPILVLSGILSPQDLSLCAELSVDAVIHNKHTLDAYSALVSQNHTSINFWLKFNCGMNRLGLSKSEGQYALDLISSLPEANQKCFKGVLAHFSSSESCNTEHTHTQLQLFQETIQHFLDHYPSIISCIANSAAIFYHPESHHSAVRLGIKLYGLPSKPIYKEDSEKAASRTTPPQTQLKPVMRLKAKILNIHKLNAGDSVGYNETFVASKPSTIITIAAGYGDGYPRHAQQGSRLYYKGHFIPLVGRVSMDLIAADISELIKINESNQSESSNNKISINIGDEVELWGEHASCTELAESANTINYQLVTHVSSRVPRLWID